MPIHEFIFLVLVISSLLIGFFYFLYKETKSSAELRKRAIEHLDRCEALFNAWVSFLKESSDSSDRNQNITGLPSLGKPVLFILYNQTEIRVADEAMQQRGSCFIDSHLARLFRQLQQFNSEAVRQRQHVLRVWSCSLAGPVYVIEACRARDRRSPLSTLRPRRGGSLY